MPKGKWCPVWRVEFFDAEGKISNLVETEQASLGNFFRTKNVRHLVAESSEIRIHSLVLPK